MNALRLSVELSLWTVGLLLPPAFLLGRWLAVTRRRQAAVVEIVVLLPLVLPPTVLGYCLLIALGPGGPIGTLAERLLGLPLVFSFEGLVVASTIANLPFAVLPIRQAFNAVPHSMREAAWVSGLGRAETLLRIELPLIWPGLLAATVLVFTHALGEFGVVLMVGGNIDGETRTVAIAIYDSVQSFDMATAGYLSAVLIGVASSALLVLRLTGIRMTDGR